MLKTLLARARQGYRTTAYPIAETSLPPLFRGRPVLDPNKCVSGCSACVEACPAGALRVTDRAPELDLGRCIFCGDCVSACPKGTISFTRDWRVAASTREELLVHGDAPIPVH